MTETDEKPVVERRWSYREAKARLDVIFDHATEAGPQIIMMRGREAAVVLTRRAYEEMLARKST